jgi:hypothetical protein
VMFIEVGPNHLVRCVARGSEIKPLSTDSKTRDSQERRGKSETREFQIRV